MPSTRQASLTAAYSWNGDQFDRSSPDSDSDSTSSDAGSAGIPRPCNSFILFRRKYSQEHSKQAGSTTEDDEKSLSRRAGDAWNALSPSEKRPWVILAKKEKEEHERKYPNYRFRPAKRPTNKAGKTTTRRQSKSFSAAQPPLKSALVPTVARTQSPLELVIHRPVPRRATSDGTVNIVNGELKHPEEYSPPSLYGPVPPAALSPSGYFNQSYVNSPSLLSSAPLSSSPMTNYSYSSPPLSAGSWLSPISPISPMLEQFPPIPTSVVPQSAMDYQAQTSYSWTPLMYTASAPSLDPSMWDAMFDVDGYISQSLPAF